MRRIITAREQVSREDMSPGLPLSDEPYGFGIDPIASSKHHNPATDLPPAPRRDPYEEMRDLYKDRPQGKIKYDLMIPTDIVNHYREHDRDYDDRLEQVIREQGIRQPVHISTDGTHAILNEGNHRLDIAQKLGIPEIPARIFVDDKVIRGDNRYGKPPVPLEPFLKKFIDTNRGRLESFWG